jgi:peroxiredoxin
VVHFQGVLTDSTSVPRGMALPPFSLPDTEGRQVRSSDFDGTPALLVAFLCSHCEHTRHIRGELARFATEYQARGLAAVGINSNDDSYAADAPERMEEERRSAGYPFPYLYDETQDVARRFRAACTPDLFLFDRERRLAYHGQFDASRPGRRTPVTGEDLRAATDAVLRGEAFAGVEQPSIGCNIKWRRGAAPDYFKPGLVHRALLRLTGR